MLILVELPAKLNRTAGRATLQPPSKYWSLELGRLLVGRHELRSDLRDVTENRPNFCGVTSACRSSKKLALSLTFTASRCARLITAVREQM